MEELAISVGEDYNGIRVDKFLSESTDYTRSFIQKLCSEQNVTKQDGTVLNQKYKVRTGEIILLNIPEPEILEVNAEDIPLDIVYEDEYLLVVNKPRGMVVHPAPGNLSGTLVNALMYHCQNQLSGINGVKRPGIVHRIDKDTTGLLVVAKTDEAHNGLTMQWHEKKAHRKYITLVNGNIKEDEGTINKPLARSPKDRKKMDIVYGGREAVTHFKVLERFGEYTLAECILETGRTHQIRVHMSYIGHPVAGDAVYGPKSVIKYLEGQCLHAGKIGFKHPRNGKYIEIESELPDYFTDFLRRIK